MMAEDSLKQRMERIAGLVSRLDEVGDSAAREPAKELVESVMALHGEALERMLLRLRGEPGGETLLVTLAADPVVAAVFLLHGLHPLDFDTRVCGAVEKARAALRSLGADVELVSSNNGAVRIRVRGAGDAHTARRIKAAIEDEIYAAAPDAASLVLLGLEKFAAPDFVPLAALATAGAGKGGY